MKPWDIKNADPQQQVGARHHTVPAAYIRRFANQQNQVWVRDRRSETPGLRKDTDLAVKDFYTFTNTNGDPDGRLEVLLSKVEDAAFPALDRLTSAVTWNTPPSDEDRSDIAALVAFQMVRGQRKRREIELHADLQMRLMASPSPTSREREHQERRELLRDVEFVPDPNEHLSMLGQLAERMHVNLLGRPIAAFSLTDGALISCDEPVLLDQPPNAQGPMLPDPPVRRPRSRRRKGIREPRRHSQLIHIQNAGGGILTAEAVLLPLGRRTLLAFGTPGTATDSNIQLDPAASRELAAEVNREILSRAYFYAFCHPDDRALLETSLPELEPLLRVRGTDDEQRRIATAVPAPIQPLLRGRPRSR